VQVNSHLPLLDPLLVARIHQDKPTMVGFFPEIPLQSKYFIHKFELYYQVVGFLVVLGH